MLLELTARNEEQRASAQASRQVMMDGLGPEQTYPTRLLDDDFQISLVAGPGQPWRTTLVAVAITLVGFMLLALVAGRKTSVQT